MSEDDQPENLPNQQIGGQHENTNQQTTTYWNTAGWRHFQDTVYPGTHQSYGVPNLWPTPSHYYYPPCPENVQFADEWQVYQAEGLSQGLLGVHGPWNQMTDVMSSATMAYPTATGGLPSSSAPPAPNPYQQEKMTLNNWRLAQSSSFFPQFMETGQYTQDLQGAWAQVTNTHADSVIRHTNRQNYQMMDLATSNRAPTQIVGAHVLDAQQPSHEQQRAPTSPVPPSASITPLSSTSSALWELLKSPLASSTTKESPIKKKVKSSKKNRKRITQDEKVDLLQYIEPSDLRIPQPDAVNIIIGRQMANGKVPTPVYQIQNTITSMKRENRKRKGNDESDKFH